MRASVGTQSCALPFKNLESNLQMTAEIVVVLGMHRSGTSLIAKSIELFGYSLGDRQMQANEDNPKGFSEDIDIVSFNDRLLESLGCDWAAPVDLELSSIGEDSRFFEEARQLLVDKTRSYPKLVLKDPRFCLLMPFWSKVFSAMSIQTHEVVVFRNPLDVANSLSSRNKFAVSFSLTLTEEYLQAVLQHCGSDALVVGYPNFMSEPRAEIDRIGKHLHATPVSDQADIFVSDFIDPDLQHHEHSLDELHASEFASRQLMEFSDCFARWSEDKKAAVPSSKGSAIDQEFLVTRVKQDIANRAELLGHSESLERSVKLLGADLQDVENRLKDRESHITRLKVELDERTGERDRQISFSEKLAEEFAQSKRVLNLHIDNLDAEVKDLQKRLEDKDRVNEHLANEIHLLNSHLADFDRIHRDLLGSVSYRLGRALTYPIRKPIVTFVLPRITSSSRAVSLLLFLRTCLAYPLKALKLISVSRIQNFYLMLTRRPDLIDQIAGKYTEDIGDPGSKEANDSAQHDVDASSLVFPVHEKNLVTVVIPVYNQLDATLRCLASIQKNWPKTPIEVLVVDDSSTDETAITVKSIPGCRYICHSENLGFLRSCNRAIDFCESPYVMLLNNDTTVTEGWLDSLVDLIANDETVGLVGSKLIYPDGRLQEAGGIIWSDGSGWNYGRLQDADLPDYNYVREVDYVSGAAILFLKETFVSLGRFDERYLPAYYEDTDFAFKVREAGLRVVYQPASKIVHYEGVSHGTDESQGIKQHQLTNRKVFHEKWKSTLEENHYPNSESLFSARDRSAGKTTILVIDHYVPQFDKDAGSRSTMMYLEAMLRSGFNVKFLGDNFYKHEPYTSQLQQMGIEVLHGPYYQKHWKQWLLENSAQIDVIYLMRPHIAGKYIDIVNSLVPKPKTIYFGHDLHYLRLLRQFEVEQDSQYRKDADKWKKIEFDLFSKVDRVFYPSIVEVEEIIKEDASINVRAIPLYAYDCTMEVVKDYEASSNIMFVGGFNHPPNLDGVRWFLEEIFPRVLSEIPDIKIHIAGSHMPEALRSLASDNVVIHGFVSDKELEDLYRSTVLSVVPLRFGAGVKGKVLEGMYQGTPVVTTTIGAEGIANGSEAITIVDSSEDFAEAIVALYRDRGLVKRLAEKSRDLVSRNFSESALTRVLREEFLVSKS